MSSPIVWTPTGTQTPGGSICIGVATEFHCLSAAVLRQIPEPAPMSCVDVCVYASAPKNEYNDITVRQFELQPTGEKISYSIHEPPEQLRRQPITILYSHAKSEDIALTSLWCDDLCRILRCRCVSYDYLGYGTTEGSATERTSCDIASQLLSILEKAYRDDSFILWGRSIGTVPTCFLAAENRSKVKAVICQSGMMTLGDMIAGGCLKSCLRERFNNEANFVKIKAPLLLLHGTDDRVVPYRNFQGLIQSFEETNNVAVTTIIQLKDSQSRLEKRERFWALSLSGAGHNDIDTGFLREYMPILIEFLQTHVGGFEGCQFSNREVRFQRKTAGASGRSGRIL